ncbi:glycosyltransferase [Kribbella sindirgiensis]|uniref:Glycosyltransferase n=1 Tax=Kribbella sindirgiensis TaxID=1124744 RepID=A0A4V2M481_9ACTN|nr:nucleotide disphospho-sugar-binding domain-containing protein [Kribbella sindirgiensis]TCC34932.1 glycosyltransferase [Kribbella sindirgiensis]
MRILFTASPFYGHVNTILPLALAAKRASHEVRFASGADFAAHVSNRGLTFWKVGPTADEAGTPSSPAFFRHTGQQRADNLTSLTARWRPDLVISEELEFGGVVAAARDKTPLLVHGLGITAAGDGKVLASEVDRLGTTLSLPHLLDLYRSATHLSVAPPSLRPAELRDRKLLSVRPALGEPAPGERLPAVLADLPYEENVHLTLGTVFHQRRPGLLAAAIAALRDLDANVIATVGPGVDPASLGPQPPNVVVERYLPHALLLPRCRLVVSQGGAGIVLGALAHGLPQLVMPQGADQFDNGAAVQRAGVGLAINSTGKISIAITEAAERLLHEPRYADAARVVGDEIHAMPTPNDVIRSLTGSFRSPATSAHQSASAGGSMSPIAFDPQSGLDREV